MKNTQQLMAKKAHLSDMLRELRVEVRGVEEELKEVNTMLRESVERKSQEVVGSLGGVCE